MGSTRHLLQVRVIDDLTLYAGWWCARRQTGWRKGFTWPGRFDEKSERPWEVRGLPFALAASSLVTPTGWTPDGQTRAVWLPG